MHVGIAVALGLWTFAAVMVVFDVAAFGFPDPPANPVLERPAGRRDEADRLISGALAPSAGPAR
jgi:hypothetical protein